MICSACILFFIGNITHIQSHPFKIKKILNNVWLLTNVYYICSVSKLLERCVTKVLSLT